jgi:hypothetical protein
MVHLFFGEDVGIPDLTKKPYNRAIYQVIIPTGHPCR